MRAFRTVRLLGGLGAVLFLAACSGPKMEVHRYNLAFVDHVVITSQDSDPFTIQRIVINGNSTDSGCTDSDQVTLQPREQHELTFWRCGTLSTIEVQTDRGTWSGTVTEQQPGGS
ncbi:MAG: hypothetical protein WDM91_08365 [Rhizomicrobium sp.]